MFRKGCFGNVIAFSPQTDTCKLCKSKPDCAKEVFKAQEAFARRVEKLELHRSPEAASIEEVDNAKTPRLKRFLDRRKKDFIGRPKKAPTSASVEALDLPDSDFAVMRKGQNPLAHLDEDNPYRVACAFMIDARVATLKDFSEHFHEIGSGLPPATAQRYARQLIKKLMNAGLLTKQGTMFCLQ